MKRLIVAALLSLSGCATTYPDYTLFCSMEYSGKCLQWARSERLYSVRQQ